MTNKQHHKFILSLKEGDNIQHSTTYFSNTQFVKYDGFYSLIRNWEFKYVISTDAQNKNTVVGMYMWEYKRVKTENIHPHIFIPLGSEITVKIKGKNTLCKTTSLKYESVNFIEFEILGNGENHTASLINNKWVIID